MITIFVTMAVVFFFSYIPLALFSIFRGSIEEDISPELMLAIELTGNILYMLSAFASSSRCTLPKGVGCDDSDENEPCCKHVVSAY